MKATVLWYVSVNSFYSSNSILSFSLLRQVLLEYLQEEIKIIEANVFVNPYTEADEEEEKEKAEKEKNEDKDIVSITPFTIYNLSFFSLLFQPV